MSVISNDMPSRHFQEEANYNLRQAEYHLMQADLALKEVFLHKQKFEDHVKRLEEVRYAR